MASKLIDVTGYEQAMELLPKIETFQYIQAGASFIQCLLWTAWIVKDTQRARKFTVWACEYGVVMNLVFVFYQLFVFGAHDSEGWFKIIEKLLFGVLIGVYYTVVTLRFAQ